MIYSFPLSIIGQGPTISIQIVSKGQPTKDCCNGDFVKSGPGLPLAQLSQSLHHLPTSESIPIQLKSFFKRFANSISSQMT